LPFRVKTSSRETLSDPCVVLLGEPPPVPPPEPPLLFPPPPDVGVGVEPLVDGLDGTLPVLAAHGFVPPELGATLGLAEDEGDPLVDGAGVDDGAALLKVHSAAGTENGSRPFTCFTPVVADGEGVGLPEGAVVGTTPPPGTGPIVVGCPPPPPRSVTARITMRTAATTPRMITRRRSRWESSIRPPVGRC
jgi:hypothetical protein